MCTKMEFGTRLNKCLLFVMLVNKLNSPALPQLLILLPVSPKQQHNCKPLPPPNHPLLPKPIPITCRKVLDRDLPNTNSNFANYSNTLVVQ